MTQLLVSVRSAEEALAALEGGAHLIDMKEPARGALGQVAPDVAEEIIAAIAGRRPVSAALGELCDGDWRTCLPASNPPRLVKVGLAGCASVRNWRSQLRELHDALPAAVKLAAVIYADWQAALAPPPEEVLDAACELSLDTVLLDTHDKRRGTLWQALPPDELQGIVARIRAGGFHWALAGSVSLASLREALVLEPHWIAVRGAACRQTDRDGSVSRNRVRALAITISSWMDFRASVESKEKPAVS